MKQEAKILTGGKKEESFCIKILPLLSISEGKHADEHEVTILNSKEDGKWKELGVRAHLF